MVFCDYYLPGFKSGGGMWTVVNLVDRFHDRYDFYVVARNHDGKADVEPYKEVKTGEWNAVGAAKVFYLDAKRVNVGFFKRLVGEIKPDMFFLNSVFSKPAITLLRARKNAELSGVPVILSPCGELSGAALKLKAAKKKLFLSLANLTGLHRHVIWRASFESDAKEIKAAIGEDIEVLCAPDLPPKSIVPDFDILDKPAKRNGAVRFIFVSRIVRKKNLHFFLERLSSCRTGEITLDIVGPIEDADYWRECEAALKTLPKNVTVNVTGALPYGEILKRMTAAHFFVLPTLNENFGYVLLEALACGAPLLISDRTAWNGVEAKGSGWPLPLEDPEGWSELIIRCIEMDAEEFSRMANAAREQAANWLADESVEAATASLLERAMGG
ncbi:MAG TPA: glycosyltransferase [Pyrinomonadaceae bacterium]|nr:glycosyltransferase [Pyrinomonadaceae bacterium]